MSEVTNYVFSNWETVLSFKADGKTREEMRKVRSFFPSFELFSFSPLAVCLSRSVRRSTTSYLLISMQLFNSAEKLSLRFGLLYVL